jgi:GNAT superfamily N-acetyltransferase
MVLTRFQTKNNKTITIRKLQSTDLENLSYYLQNLSEESKKRFGPHPFDLQPVIEFYKEPNIHQAYIGENPDAQEIIAYSIIKFGILEADFQRYLSYGIELNHQTDCEFAPSVADAWQSCGIGNAMFQFILEELKKTAIQRIILWGGVQADNEKAVQYYLKHGFQNMGLFTHNGENFDMILEV